MSTDNKKKAPAHMAPAESGAVSDSKKKKRKRKKAGPVRKTLTVIGTVILSLILIAVISVSIIAAAGAAVDYLRENEHSERLEPYRSVFFEQYDAFVNEEESFFDGE